MEAIIFSSMCIILFSGGGEDCSYQWTAVPNDTLQMVFWQYGGYLAKWETLGGFHVMDEKIIYLDTHATSEDIMHEILHVKCLQYYKLTGENHKECYIDDHFIYHYDSSNNP